MPRAVSAHTTVASAVMSRAWAIFRETYSFPRIPFLSLGRKCFAWALKKAWSEARAAADLATTPTDILQGRIASITAELESLKYRGWGTDLVREHNRLNAALRPLAKELLRRSLAASVQEGQIELALAA